MKKGETLSIATFIYKIIKSKSTNMDLLSASRNQSIHLAKCSFLNDKRSVNGFFNFKLYLDVL